MGQRFKTRFKEFNKKIHPAIPHICLFAVGATLLAYGVQEISQLEAQDSPNITNRLQFNDAKIRMAVCQLYRLIEGAFGALIAVIAGVGAIISSAFGAFRAAWSLLAVSVGSFILRALISLFFGVFACGTGEGQARDTVETPDQVEGLASGQGVPAKM